MFGKDFIFDLQRFADIRNHEADTEISGSEGNDYIYNEVLFDEWYAGDDPEEWAEFWGYSSGNNVTIEAYEGDDYISNEGGSYVFIDAGDGDDTIDNKKVPYKNYELNQWDYVPANKITINAGAGDDCISNEGGANVLFNYSDGDGNDIIKGFNATSTLKIGGGTGNYSTIKIGSDIIVMVGEGSITLQGAASLSSVNISGVETVNPLLIAGTEVNDTIKNTLDGATISALGGNDSIHNGTYSNLDGSNVLIDAGDGFDSIVNNGANMAIYADAGNDSISNSGANVSINGGAGNDTIHNGNGFDYNLDVNPGSNVLINAGDGNDSIHNYGSNVTIDGGAGDDTISNTEGMSYSVSIDAGAGNDFIDIFDGSGITVNGGAGNDYIFSADLDVSISGGAGDDTIVNYNRDGVIDGDAGNDLISLGADTGNNLIQYTEGDGLDTIVGFNEDDTLEIGGGTGTYSSQTSGSDIVVTVGKGKITLTGAASLESVNIAGVAPVSSFIVGTEGSDTIENSFGGVTISALGGNDSISNHYGVASVSINGGDGADKISNYGSHVSIDAGAGNDYIDNSGYNSTINAGAGNDSIYNDGWYVTINAGAGNDSIYNDGWYVTINAGAGADTISNYGSNVSIDAGEGNDYISNGGDDVIIENVSIDAGEGNDSIYNYGGDNALIGGGAGNDSISNAYGSNVTIDGGAGNDSIDNSDDKVSINGGTGNDSISLFFAKNNVIVYNDGDGNDTIRGFHSSSTLKIGGGTGTYSSQTSGDDIVVTVGKGKITLKGAASLSAVNIAGVNTFNIVGTEGNDNITNTLDGATINALGGNDRIYNEGSSNVLINAGAGNDTIYNEEVEYEGEKLTEHYFEDEDDYEFDYETHISPASFVTIDGGDGDDYILNNSDFATPNVSVSINAGAGNDTVEDFESSNVTIEGGAGNDSISLDKKFSVHEVITYADGDGNDTIRGFHSSSTLKIGGGTGTYSSQTSGDDIVVTVGKGSITLQGAASLSKVNISGKEVVTNSWTLDGTTATYGDLVVKGVKSLEGLSLSGTTVTVSKAALGTGKVTVSDGYTLKLGSDVTAPKTTNAWSLSDTTAKYNQTTTAGYTLASNAITYSKKSAKTLATVAGVKSVDGLSLNKKVVTVSKASLGTGKVTVSDGYTLKLGSDVTAPKTTNAWTLSGTTAKYNQTTAAGYTLASNAITYSKKSAKTLATVAGVKSLDGLSLKKKVVTVSKASLGTGKVTVSDGYTLKLGSNVTAPKTTNAWTLSGTTAKYNQTTAAGYTLASNAITYSKKSAKTLATVAGVKSVDGLSLKKKVVTVSKESLGTKKVTVSDGYTLKLGSDVTASKTTAAGWTLSGTTATYKSAATSKGYKLSSNAITYSKATAAKNLATIKGATSTDGLKLKSKTITAAASALSKKVTVSGGYTFDFAADYSKATITGSSANDTIVARGKNILVNSGKGNDTVKILGTGTVTGGAGNDTLAGGAGNNKLYGGAGNDSLSGGAGADTLWGDAGNDKLYGGTGNDVFVYKPDEGTDTIFDYDSGDMLQILKSDGTSGGFYSSSSFASGKLTLDINGGGSVVFSGMKSGDKININGRTRTIKSGMLK